MREEVRGVGKYRLRAKDLRNKDAEELRKLLEEQRSELASLRHKAMAGSIDSPARIRELRKNIARILTIMVESSRKAAQQAPGARQGKLS